MPLKEDLKLNQFPKEWENKIPRNANVYFSWEDSIKKKVSMN